MKSNPVVTKTPPIPCSHDLFKDVDFSDPAALFQSKGVHSEFASVLPVLQRLKGAQKKKMFADKKVCTPNTSPHPLHRSAPGLGSSGILNEEEAKMIRREVSWGMKRRANEPQKGCIVDVELPLVVASLLKGHIFLTPFARRS